MTSVVCTLFEGHYHHGLAALTNSLYCNGFRGIIYAGYKGELPKWASECYKNDDIALGVKILQVADGLQIHFIFVETKIHFTNYKMDFMLKLWNGPAKDATGMFYFDPDIVIRCKWAFFEKWISYGVALVHEIHSNDMPSTHPIKKEWEMIIKNDNLSLKRSINSYINAGFCGIAKNNIEFLNIWSVLMRNAEMNYGFKREKFQFTDRTDPFYAGDQDILNMAVMCCESPISEIGPEGMDFIHGGFTMSHATGSPKPWKRNYLYRAILGKKPTLSDKAYWSNTKYPIRCFSVLQIEIKKMSITLASLISRFYLQN